MNLVHKSLVIRELKHDLNLFLKFSLQLNVNEITSKLTQKLPFILFLKLEKS